MQQLVQEKTLRIRSRSLKGEVWAEAYPGYCLSNMGRWYSEARGRIMRQNKNSSGYKRVTLMIDNKKKHVFTHIKVVEIFGDAYGRHIPYGASSLRELGLSIDHLDNNRCNPKQSNLELVTHQVNCLRKFNRSHKEDI